MIAAGTDPYRLAKPQVVPVNLAEIPAELKTRDAWVLWRFVLRTDPRSGKQEWAKVPFDTAGHEARANDPRTWRAFSVVEVHFRAHPELWDGIGFMFSDAAPFAGVDLDGCRRDDGSFVPWSSGLRGKFATPGVPDAIEFLKQLNTYAEVSPSGTGFKLIGIGKKPGKRCELDAPDCEHHGIAFYERARFFTLTGCRVPGTPATVNDFSEALTSLYNSIFGKTRSKANRNGKPQSNGSAPTDDDVLRAIGLSKNADKIRRLLDGDAGGYPSNSEADEALACCLAFWTRDTEQIGRLMRGSKLAREKWDREDYLTRTIARALETVTESYEWSKSRGSALQLGNDDDLGLTTAGGRTEVANGRRLAKLHGADFRWCDLWKKSLVWDGKRWAVDDQRRLDAMAKDVYQSLWQEIAAMAPRIGDDDGKELRELVRFAKQTGMARGIEAMLKLARSEPDIPIAPDVLDTDPCLYNVENGTLDLRTGQLRPHRREDYLTKLCRVTFDSKADCPLWLGFLRDITAGDDDLQRFLRRAVGMSLTGVIEDHVLFFLYGTGANGKSTFILGVQQMMGGDYAIKAAPDLLLVKKEAHPTERADLAGKRFVACVEAGEGRRLAESLVKELTGGDSLRVRRMREDFWEFQPTHKIFLAANHKPIIRGTDWGIWRRVKLVPFTVKIPDERQDRKLPAKLKKESAGILNWALLGCLEWQAQGLGEPETVHKATAAYRNESDILGAFIADCCVVGDGCEAPASGLYQDYRKWAEQNGERVLPQNVFGAALTDRDYVSDRFTSGIDKGKKKWIGIGRKSPLPTGEE